MARNPFQQVLLTGSVSLVALGFAACGNDRAGDPSQIKVTNGEELKEEDFPAVVRLVMETSSSIGTCSGTFVNDSQVVTAGHCVFGLSEEDPKLYYVKVNTKDSKAPKVELVQALNFKLNPNYSLEQNGGVNGSDLALVNFEKNTTATTMSIAKESPKVGSTLTIVGYGDNYNYISAKGHFEGTGSGTKRFGSNEIHQIENGFISFVGIPSSIDGIERGKYVSSGSGDSGGPMFVNGQLVGVTSGGGLAFTEEGFLLGVSHYVDLHSEESQSFLQEHLKKY